MFVSNIPQCNERKINEILRPIIHCYTLVSMYQHKNIELLKPWGESKKVAGTGAEPK
jgi:hypothetical protein